VELGSGLESVKELLGLILSEIRGMRKDMRAELRGVRGNLKEVHRTTKGIAMHILDISTEICPDTDGEAEAAYLAGVEKYMEMADQTLQ
jgi:hypothetical protein